MRHEGAAGHVGRNPEETLNQVQKVWPGGPSPANATASGVNNLLLLVDVQPQSDLLAEDATFIIKHVMRTIISDEGGLSRFLPCHTRSTSAVVEDQSSVVKKMLQTSAFIVQYNKEKGITFFFTNYT